MVGGFTLKSIYVTYYYSISSPSSVKISLVFWMGWEDPSFFLAILEIRVVLFDSGGIGM